MKIFSVVRVVGGVREGGRGVVFVFVLRLLVTGLGARKL